MEEDKAAAPTVEEHEDEVEEEGTADWKKMPKNGGPKCEYIVSRNQNAGKRCGRGGLYPLNGQKYCLNHYRTMKRREERANRPEPRKRKREGEGQQQKPAAPEADPGRTPYPEAEPERQTKRSRQAPEPKRAPPVAREEPDGGQEESAEDAYADSRTGRQKVTELAIDDVEPPKTGRTGNGGVRGGHNGGDRGKRKVTFESEDDSDSSDDDSETDDEGYAQAYQDYQSKKAKKQKPINERYAYKGPRTALWKSMKRATELATLGGARRPGGGIFNILSAHE